MTKRQKFILLSASLAVAFWFLPQIVQNIYSGLGWGRGPIVVSLVLALILTFLATLYAFSFDLRFPEHLIFPVYPILLTSAFWLYRPGVTHLLFLAILFTFFTLYILFLTLNILNVATVHTVPLKKAALSTLYFLGLTIGFFNIKGILTLHPSPFLLFTFYFLLSLTLALPFVYAIQIKPSPIEEEIGPKPKLMLPEVAVIAVLLAETALAASFLSVSPIILSVFLSGILFVLIGLMQNVVRKTLTKRIFLEQAVVGVGLVGTLVISSFFS